MLSRDLCVFFSTMIFILGFSLESLSVVKCFSCRFTILVEYMALTKINRFDLRPIMPLISSSLPSLKIVSSSSTITLSQRSRSKLCFLSLFGVITVISLANFSWENLLLLQAISHSLPNYPSTYSVYNTKSPLGTKIRNGPPAQRHGKIQESVLPDPVGAAR